MYLDEIINIVENIARKRLAEGKDITFKFLQDQVPDASCSEMIVAMHNAERYPCKEGEIDCPICLNKRYIEKLDDQGFLVTQVCQCAYANDTNNKIMANGFTKTWSDFETNNDWQREMLRKAKAFVNSKDDWFYVGGQSGSGKTLICTIIGNELTKKNRRILKINWSEFIQKIKNSMMDKDVSRFEAYINRAKTYDMLYIDDLCKTYSDADLNYLFQIINYRYANNLQTFISSERDIRQLHGIDEAVAGRIIEKTRMNDTVNSFMITIKKDGRNDWRRTH